MKGDDIVISGFSAYFPQADHLVEFKEKLYAGVDFATEDDARWPRASLQTWPMELDTDVATGKNESTVVAVPCYICKSKYQDLEKEVKDLQNRNESLVRDNDNLRQYLQDSEEEAQTAEKKAKKALFSAECITEQCVSIYTRLKTVALFFICCFIIGQLKIVCP
ncbi:hypothetical protein MRX96_054889 [Rhipicephalus microplus]